MKPSGKLSAVRIGEFVVQLDFDSGDTVSSYDLTVFKNNEGDILSIINAEEKKSLSIPKTGFIGVYISDLKLKNGFCLLRFASGASIEIRRTRTDHEIGLITVGDKVLEIH